MSVVDSIIGRWKKRDHEREVISSSAPSYSSFIPHSCHYDPFTLLNKNGELLQTIKIEDYTFPIDADHYDLRLHIRNSVLKHIRTPDLAIWVHTVRRKRELGLEWPDCGYFCNSLHKAIHAKLSDGSGTHYVNDLYVTVVSQGLNEQLSKFVAALSFAYLRYKHKSYLKQKSLKLQAAVDGIVEDLKKFRVRKLGVKGNRSELLELFSYLVTLNSSEYFLDMRDLSEKIVDDYELNFGFNVLQSQKSGKSKRFAAIFGLKEYRDASLEAVDVCLQRKSEFVVTETIRFVNRSQAIKSFKKQAETFQISGNQDLMIKLGLEETIKESHNSPTEFCEHLINVMVIADSLDELKTQIEDTVYSFSLIGITMVRYDLAIEDNFWAQLPGNFPCVVKPRYILSKYSCGFATLHNFVSGSLLHERWGSAISVFLSNSDRPYFFNFHATGGGHTLVIGPPNSGRTLLVNCLLSESRRLGTKLITFDHSGKSIIFVKAMSGQFHLIDYRSENNAPSINPLLLEDTPGTRTILHSLFTHMAANSELENNVLSAKIEQIVDHVFTLPKESRSLDNIADLLLSLGGNTFKWCRNGEFAAIFSGNRYSNIDWQSKVLAFHTGVISHKPDCISVVVHYLIEVMLLHLDGSPTILTFDESWKLRYVFATKQDFDILMQRLTSLNVVVIFTSENMALITASEFTPYIEHHIDTRIFMPNPAFNKLYMKVFSLSKDEYETMIRIPIHDRYFLLKQGDHSVVLTLNLEKIHEVNVLSAAKNTVKFMHEAILEKGDSPSEWLPLFYEKCED